MYPSCAYMSERLRILWILITLACAAAFSRADSDFQTKQSLSVSYLKRRPFRLEAYWESRLIDGSSELGQYMIKHRLLTARDKDLPTDFEGVYDFDEAFVQPFSPSGRPVDLPVLDGP